MKAWQLIEDPKHWCADEFARDSGWRGCDPRDKDAVCWCADGALMRVYPDPVEYYDIYQKASALIRERYGATAGGVISFNDIFGHEAIVTIFKELDV